MLPWAFLIVGIALGVALARALIPAPPPPNEVDPLSVGLPYAWLAFGFAAQAVFMARMLVQWIASERAQRSVVPKAFWWLSLVGGCMLMVYFVRRGDPVGVWGQLLGIVVYIRNLTLSRRDEGEREST